MKKTILVLALVVGAGVVLAHSYFGDRGRFTTEPELTGLARTVSGNDLVSDRDPAAVLRFDPVYRYLGGQKFVLYGVADAEQHFFVETTTDDRLESVYWVQYEAYLPDKRHTYDYQDSPRRVTLGSHELYTDTDAFAVDPAKKHQRGTDGAMAREFLASKGYTYPSEVMYARLVHLTDAARNKELMIIFMDDLVARHGVTAADVAPGGAAAARWPAIETAHLERIQSTLEVLPRDSLP